MNGENKNKDEHLSEGGPELSAMEAALAELRPRRERRFADDLKNRIRDALSGDSADSPSDGQIAVVKIPLTHYIRIAQFNAAVGGLLAGLCLGAMLGGAGVYFATRQLETEPKQPAPSHTTAAPLFARRLLETDTSLSPLERALLEEMDEETQDGRK